MVDELEELEDLVHVMVRDLPSQGYGVMEEIRRQGKLCDVTLRVGAPCWLGVVPPHIHPCLGFSLTGLTVCTLHAHPWQ
uniref:Uncharacterized protein n=1 Tax=Xenopus tropicalis TaxID=8364 RepID=A0A803JUK0_XENTR